jgi:SAM-dependent methyltransferase
MPINSLLTRLIPKYTKRRLVAGMVLTLLTQPNRLRQRLNAQNVFLHMQFSKVNAFCCICGGSGSLYFDMPDLKLRRDHGIGVLRETLACKSCGSTSRQRTLAHVLIKVLREEFNCQISVVRELIQQSKKVDIWDTDTFSPLSAILQSSGKGVVSKYLPDRTFGEELASNVFNIDLQRISFESNRFDIILSSDIMEHVRNDSAAHREIFRCLRPGGVYIFTVPYRENQVRTLRLVDASSETDVFLTRPHYHGDPITGGILSYRIYGRDLIDELQAMGFVVRFLWLDVASEGIFGGDCFIATKPKVFDPSRSTI